MHILNYRTRAGAQISMAVDADAQIVVNGQDLDNFLMSTKCKEAISLLKESFKFLF